MKKALKIIFAIIPLCALFLTSCASTPAAENVTSSNIEENSVPGNTNSKTSSVSKKTSAKNNSDVEKIEIAEPVIEPEVIILPDPFDDWQYKGFGAEIPAAHTVFLESWVKNDEEDGCLYRNAEINTVILYMRGINVDQAYAALSYMEAQIKSTSEVLENYDTEEDFWLKINPEYMTTEKPYVAVRIYKSKIKIEE